MSQHDQLREAMEVHRLLHRMRKEEKRRHGFVPLTKDNIRTTILIMEAEELLATHLPDENFIQQLL